MGIREASALSLGVWLRLGRVSNLPTVWTNVLAALALSRVSVPDWLMLALMGNFSLFYVGGMFLNDAFDRELDAVQRPSRPIPAGIISARSVFVAGGLLLAVGIGGCVLLSTYASGASVVCAGASATALAGCIVAYNVHHKGNRFSPLVMGLCRVLVYVSVVFSVSPRWSSAAGAGALSLLAHLIGLTYIAKQESLNRLGSLWPLALLAVSPIYGWALSQGQLDDTPYSAGYIVILAVWLIHSLRFLLIRHTWLPGPRNVPGAVVRLIAGISLVDAVLISTTGSQRLAAVAVGACILTRGLQRFVPGT